MLSAIPEDVACDVAGAVSPDDTDEISVNIKRTFIELVATPKRAHRVRSLTDTELLFTGEDVFSSALSDASTGTPPDEEVDAQVKICTHPADWASPFWGPSEDGFYNECALEPLPLPASASAEICMPSIVFDFPLGPEYGAMSWEPQIYFDASLFVSNCHTPSQDVHSCTSTPDAFAGATKAAHSGETWLASSKTTIMLRNLPAMYTRPLVIEMLEDEDFGGCYDLVYVPMDFSGKCCLGYAFVNFLNPQDAIRCWDAFDGFLIGEVGQAACEVVWSDPHQGIDALVERYRNSPVMHESVPEEWKPAFFVDGVKVPFPQPTEKVKAPKQKNTRSKAKRDH